MTRQTLGWCGEDASQLRRKCVYNAPASNQDILIKPITSFTSAADLLCRHRSDDGTLKIDAIKASKMNSLARKEGIHWKPTTSKTLQFRYGDMLVDFLLSDSVDGNALVEVASKLMHAREFMNSPRQ